MRRYELTAKHGVRIHPVHPLPKLLVLDISLHEAFSLPSFGGAFEVGNSYAEAERGELSEDGVLRQRGLSAVVGRSN